MIETSQPEATDFSPFHAGEQALQARFGKREEIESLGRQMIRDHMPDQHRRFYAQLPFLIAGSIDGEGFPWASIIEGKPGFLQSPDPATLSITGSPRAGDPLHQAWRAGDDLGLLGIDLATRRRNRLNVRVKHADDGHLTLEVDQAFGNCPQYIQTRTLRAADAPARQSEPVSFTALDDRAAAMIRSADTLFVASFAGDQIEGRAGGVDVSHRGGRPGFVKVDGDRLTIPDYAGNFHFNTFGNFLLNPKAGLLFVDFETGDVLMLTGRVELIWDGPEVTSFRGAERAWSFTLDHGLLFENTLAWRFAFEDYSPNTLLTGDWQEADARLAAEAKGNVWRPFRVVRTVDESETIRSLHLEPDDGDGLLSFAPGQYVPLHLSPEDGGKALVRTYSLSSAPGDPFYRISVKREAKGTVSSYLHERVQTGDRIELRLPRGDFALDAADPRPALLLAAGVGITPMIAMARHIVVEGMRTRKFRPTTLVHVARSVDERGFFDEARQLEAMGRGALRYLSLITRPAADEREGEHFHRKGRLSSDLLTTLIGDDQPDVFLCGPEAFMQSSYDLLRGLDVADRRIHAEAFGPSALRRDGAEGEEVAEAETVSAVVTFARSNRSAVWKPADGSLLDFAEAQGLMPEFGCRNGACGTCAVALQRGAVAYRHQPHTAQENEVLICSAVPARNTGNLSLDL